MLPCAGADEHERKQDCFGKRRPLLEIDRTVARCGHDADDLKRRVVHGLVDRIVHAADIDGDENDGACGDAEIQAKLLVFEHRFELAEQEHVIKAEVHAEEEHEHGDDGLQEVAVPAHAAVFNGEAAVPAVPNAMQKLSNTGIPPSKRHTMHSAVSKM